MAFGCEPMITKEELARIKEIRKTNLYYEEKEYLQYIFLNAISQYSENFVFKGGTCLRICYGLERASEDLDFSTNLKPEKIKQIIEKCLKNFDLLNIKYNIYAEKQYQGNFRMEIRFEGPLFSGNPESTNTLKIDFNKQKAYLHIVNVVQKLFSDVPLFTIVVLDEKEILAEKIRALINRNESRDLYDLWILINKQIDLDKRFLLIKLKEEKSNLNNLKLPSKQKYELDLKDLVKVLPTYEQVKNDVIKYVQNIK